MRGVLGGSFTVAVAALIASLAFGTGTAGAVEIVDELPIDPDGIGPYTVAEDGSVWAIGQSSGVVYNLDTETGGISHSFQTFAGFYQSIGFHNDRVFAMDTPYLYSWDADSEDPIDPGRITSDFETGNRIGSNQAILRVTGSGSASLALGQTNKVATLNLTDLDSTPFYGQSFFGTGINDPTSTSNAFEACNLSGTGVVIGEPTPYCGQGHGKSGDLSGQFGYAIDSAFGLGGVYVLESNDHEVSHILMGEEGCPCPGIRFGSGPGNAAGQLNQPYSMRRVPATGNLLISSVASRRIDEFSGGGAYIRSFGFGVRTGANQLETCGIGIGPCQAGVPTSTEPRAMFTQLDIVDGLLYAGTPTDNSIQVISLEGGSGPQPKVRLSASPTKVRKGAKTTLTAKLLPCSSGDKALFQEKAGAGFDNLGSGVRADASCRAKKRVKVTKKSVFRAVSINSAGGTLATSPKVTVRVK